MWWIFTDYFFSKQIKLIEKATDVNESNQIKAPPISHSIWKREILFVE